LLVALFAHFAILIIFAAINGLVRLPPFLRRLAY
jgi:hypothetical protein